MHILFLCQHFPFPPQGGAKARPFHMIRHLTQLGHQVAVCSLDRSGDEAQEARTRTRWLRWLLHPPSDAPGSIGCDNSNALYKQVQDLLHSTAWDAIVVHGATAAPYVAQVQGIAKLLDFGELDSQHWMRQAQFTHLPMSWFYAAQGRKIRDWEKCLAQHFDVCTAASGSALQALQGLGLQGETDCLPDGVDTDYFSPGASPYSPDTISLLGRTDYRPNRECLRHFCQQVWPRLTAMRPTLKLHLVGCEPRFASRSLGAVRGLAVSSPVEDARTALRASALVVVPLHIADGSQHEILQAMALGVPVVTTSAAAAHVDAHAQAHLVVANTPQAQVRAILDLVRHPRKRRLLSLTGRQRMLSQHAWPHAMQRLDSLLSRSLKVAAGRAAQGAKPQPQEAPLVWPG